MTRITATELKAKWMQILDRVQAGERFLVTRRGKAVAEVGPISQQAKGSDGPGFAKGSVRVLGDIIEPLDVEWESLK